MRTTPSTVDFGRDRGHVMPGFMPEMALSMITGFPIAVLDMDQPLSGAKKRRTEKRHQH